MFLVLVNVTRGGSGKYSLASTSLERRAECLLLRIAVIPGRQVTGEIGFLSSIILSLSSQGSTIQLSVDDVSKNSNDLDFGKWHENMLVKIESQVHRPHPPTTYILHRKSK